MKTFPSRIVAAVVIIIFGFVGCKKDKNDAKKPDCRIISITSTPSGEVTKINYNSEGKISSISNALDTTTYTYNGSIATGITSSGTFKSKRTITTNSSGLATNVRIEQNVSGTLWSNAFYEYNGTELIRVTSTSSSNPTPIISTITWTNGNLISINSGTSGSTLEYFTDKPAQAGDYLHLFQLLNGFEVYKPRNAIKSISAGATVNTFNYNFDGDGKITSMTITGNPTGTFFYEYQCQ